MLILNCRLFISDLLQISDILIRTFLFSLSNVWEFKLHPGPLYTQHPIHNSRRNPDRRTFAEKQLRIMIPSCLALLIYCFLTMACNGVLCLELLYQFGTRSSDSETPKVDDGGSPEIPLSITFPFFAMGQRSLHVNNNGVISFNVQVSQFTPEAFPLSDGRSFIAPFWADVHNGIKGNVYYRESTDPSILQRATKDIRKNFKDQNSFSATWVFIATWYKVTFYGGSSTTPVNTFQCVLITDERTSFAMFNYADIYWTTGTASGGDPLTGVGGSAAQAGFNGGDNNHFFSLPTSRTSEMMNIEETSNVNFPGRWIFRIDGDTIDPSNGCSLNGQFFRRGDVFWAEEKCQTKCRCLDLENRLLCQNLSCGQLEQCHSVDGVYRCLPEQTASCVVFGDPHYHTFDGSLFHFQGTCSYILSKPCLEGDHLPSFSIESTNENRVGSAVSWLRSIKCGCEFNERYYSFKTKFWANDDCTLRCLCEGPGEVLCMNETCSKGEFCLVENGIRGCYPKRAAVCTVSRNNGLQTFDGASFDFRDEYAYTLLKICGSNSYNLSHFEIKLGRKKMVNGSWIKSLTINFPDHEIKIGDSENIIKVNAFAISLPFIHSSGKLKIYRNGNDTMVELDNSFQILYSSEDRVNLTLSTAYYNHTCGLCGYFNGNPTDDFRKANGKVTENAAEFVDNWKTFADDMTCNGQCEELYTVCTNEDLILYQEISLCGIINDPTNSSFLNCHEVVNPSPFFRSCLYSMCLNGGNITSLCSSLQAYADACIGAKVTQTNWRSSTFCPLPCPDHSHFAECTSACPMTCVSLEQDVVCTLPCVEGCQCDQGFVLKDGHCIPKSHCGCVYEGLEVRTNETFWLDRDCQTRCYCNGSDNAVYCESASCRLDEFCSEGADLFSCLPRTEAVCIMSGYSHLYTFDTLAYDLQSTCSHIISTVSPSSPHLPHFLVQAENEDRNTSLALWLHQVEVKVYGYNISASKAYKHTVMVNNERVNLPLRLGHGEVNLYSFGLFLILETDFGLRVIYDWNMFLTVTVPRIFFNFTQGLCGQFNGDPADDLETPDGEIVANLLEFAESWMVARTAFCELGCHRVCPSCEQVLNLPVDVLQLCALIVSKDNIFSHCHAKVNPTFFYHNCIFDSCIDRGDRQTACNWLQNYGSSCQAQGVVLPSWRNLTMCSKSQRHRHLLTFLASKLFHLTE
ncbi:hypothetical protein chiPu_0019153 [Chiloscyllium punctatum]|uniref:VWFD domain-containing protein n=1 Tax=Chiloscyllium punctatum TaxID=137246 RepID=A0A401RRD8_CHIPU|nr:hypothetical protein [Chiloscyllium punctatum]